jgi:hypothetical protein
MQVATVGATIKQSEAPTEKEKKILPVASSKKYWLGSKQDIIDAAMKIDQNCKLPSGGGTLQWAKPQFYSQEKQDEVWILQQPPENGWKPANLKGDGDEKGRFTYQAMIAAIDVKKFKEIVGTKKMPKLSLQQIYQPLTTQEQLEKVEYFIGTREQLYVLRQEIFNFLGKYERTLVQEITPHDSKKNLWKIRCWRLQDPRTGKFEFYGRSDMPCLVD